ncbi:hypothetical protein [Breoghania corrubedonensis]|nr:hypothetical protein [Breoghania corrubedonensis]
MTELNAIRRIDGPARNRLALLVLRQSLAELRPALVARQEAVGEDLKRLHAATAATGSYARALAMTTNPPR